MCLRVKHSEQGHYLKSNLDESKVILYKIKMECGQKDILKKKEKRERFETTTGLFPSGYKNKSKMKVKKIKGIQIVSNIRTGSIDKYVIIN